MILARLLYGKKIELVIDGTIVDTEDKEGKREGMVGKEEKEDSSERQWEGSGV